MNSQKSTDNVPSIELQMFLDGMYLSLEFYGNDTASNAKISYYVMWRIMGVLQGRDQDKERELPLPPIPEGTSPEFFEEIVLSRTSMHIKGREYVGWETILCCLYSMCSERVYLQLQKSRQQK